ncbi:hypothetical protein BDZ45DRAFT_724307 [Acephala macrosclerotiorum]|nr:hypothetical protein BDZ45DRAFT_724307 [Acephala macrosclerotiorum]
MASQCPVCGKAEDKPLKGGHCVSLMVLDDTKTKDKSIRYNYDFGDGGEHVISCTRRAEVKTQFVCLEGGSHGCAEDFGGYTGWQELLEAYDSLILQKIRRRRYLGSKIPSDEVAGTSGSSTGNAVLLISLEEQPFLDEIYSEVMAKLRLRISVVEATQIASAMQHLSNGGENYAVVIISDPGVMKKIFIAVQEKLVDYACGGGNVIFGFHVSIFVQPNDLARFFMSGWLLDWKAGTHTRETFSLVSQVGSAFTNGCLSHSSNISDLLDGYGMKALHLSNAKFGDRVYVCRLVCNDSPAVFAKYGFGYLGWIRDVNTEAGTTRLRLETMSRSSKFL